MALSWLFKFTLSAIASKSSLRGLETGANVTNSKLEFIQKIICQSTIYIFLEPMLEIVTVKLQENKFQGATKSLSKGSADSYVFVIK